MLTLYTVMFLRNPNTSNLFEISRYFQTKRAALSWARRLKKQHYVLLVQVWNQVGGELVAEFHA